MTPRCPRCELNDETERNRTTTAPWYCRRCDLVYVGSPDEWAAEHERRIVRCSPIPDGGR